jgi:hypothetical protein
MAERASGREVEGRARKLVSRVPLALSRTPA